MIGGLSGGSIGGLFDDDGDKPHIAISGFSPNDPRAEGIPSRGAFGRRSFTSSGAFGVVSVGGRDGQGRTPEMQAFADRLTAWDDVIAEALDPDQIMAAAEAANEAILQSTNVNNFDAGQTLLARVNAVFEATESRLGSLFHMMEDVGGDNVEVALAATVQLNDFIAEDFSQTMEDVADAVRKANLTLFESFGQMQGEIETLAVEFDGTVESFAALSLASSNLQQVERQLLQQIEQVRTQISFGSDSLRERFERDTETDQETYNRLSLRIEKQFSELRRADDPLEIQRLAARIQGDIGDAWQLLTPEQRELLKEGRFNAWLDQLDTLVGGQLDETIETIKQQAKEIREAISDALQPVSEDMASASDSLEKASLNIAAAANAIPAVISVQLEEAIT